MGNKGNKDLSGSGEKEDVDDLKKKVSEEKTKPIKPADLEDVPVRNWVKLDDETTFKSNFVLCTHNILAPRYTHISKYPFCPQPYLATEYRNRKLMQHIAHFQPVDLFCMQELQGNVLEALLPELEKYYDHTFKRITKRECFRLKRGEEEEKASKDAYSQALLKEKEGVGIFWKKETFDCLQKYEIEFNREAYKEINEKTQNSLTIQEFINNTCLNSHNVACGVLLRHNVTKKSILVFTLHAFFNWKNWSGQVYQLETLFRKIGEIEENYDGIVLCGDFNSTPDSKSFEFITKGELANFDESEVVDPTKDEKEKEKVENTVRIYKYLDRLPKHDLGFRQSYPPEIKPRTAFSPRSEMGMIIDYVFSSGGVEPVEVLDIPKTHYIAKEIPNSFVYSDHILLGAKFVFKESRKGAQEKEEQEGEME